MQIRVQNKRKSVRKSRYVGDVSMVSPCSRVPERAPDWFFVATEACGGGTPDLGFFLGVSVFIGFFGVGLTSGGPPSHPRDRGTRPGGRARPPPSWTARDSSGPLRCSVIFFWSIKNRQKLVRQLDSVWYSFSVKLKNKEKQKLALGSRLIG